MKRRLSSRWVDLSVIADRLSEVDTRYAALSRKLRRERALRFIRRIEERNSEAYTRPHGNRIMVSIRALETLVEENDRETMGRIESEVTELSQKVRDANRKIGGHGSVIRGLDRRVEILEKKTELATSYLQGLAELDCRKLAAEMPQNSRPAGENSECPVAHAR